MNILKVFSIFIFVLLSGSLQAQINVEKFRGKDSINLSFSYTNSDTNTTSTDTFLFNILASKSIDKNEYLAVVGTTVADKNDEEFKNNSFAHLRYFRNINDWGPEVFYQYSKNDFSNQLKRRVLGAGLRKIITKEAYSVRGGISLFKEELVLAVNHDEGVIEEEMDINRANSYLSFTQKYLSITIYYQPNVEDIEEHNLALESLLTFNIWKERVKMDFVYNITRNNTLDIENSQFMQVISIQW